MGLKIKNLWFIISLLLIILANINICMLTSNGKHNNIANEIYEIRIYETALPGTKATLNEAFDRLMREQKNCFAQLETATDLDWIEFDPGLLIFMTIANVPSNAKTTQQAVLHLMCSSNKMQTIHFLIHVTRRNKHPPKFLRDQYQFYVPTNLKIGSEVGKLQVIDNDPIIYNSQIQLTILPNFAFSESSYGIHYKSFTENTITTSENIESFWEIHKNGSLTVKKLIKNLQIYRYYIIRVLAVDFGSPQLFSICNVTIIPVSVSQPKNVRINVANTKYQIFEWDLPNFGIAEKFRLTISRNKTILYTQDIEANKNIALSTMKFLPGADYNVIITAVEVDGETPSDPHYFMLTKTELECEGECAQNSGKPLCYYSHFHKIEQFHDLNNAYCLCYHGFTSPQCDVIESCSGEQSIEEYGSINWPFTSVNKSVNIPCPYNTDHETIKRTCIWNEKLEVAQWQNVSKNDVCKKQSTILVHLGVLANYAERADQTASGLRAVLRFLNSILQMPAFKSEISETQFDVKIAEHVAQVIDTIAGLNISAVAGNTTNISDALINFLLNFNQRIPVPFNLQSSEKGLHFKTWHWLISSSTFESNENEKLADEFPVEFARRCYIHLPSRRRQKLEANGQLVLQKKLSTLSQIVRVACLRASTLLPYLDGYSPLLFVTVDNNIDELTNKTIVKKKRSNLSNKKLKKNNILTKETIHKDFLFQNQKFFKKQKIAGDGKALIALRPEFYLNYNEKMFDRMNVNYTCAIYDHNIFGWSITGITILSRNFEDGFILCETIYLGTFALLPEILFKNKPNFSFKIFITIMPIISVVFTILCTFFLICIAILQKSHYTDPAFIIFLLTIFVIHIIYFIILIAPHIFSHIFLLEYDHLIYLILQYCFISISALITLLNESIYARLVDLELGVKRFVSFNSRIFIIFIIGIFLPTFFCLITWLFNAYIYNGIATLNPQFQSFNWIFILTFVLPLIIFIGSSTGYSGYTYYYAHVLANLATPVFNHNVTLLFNNIEELGKQRLLKDLGNFSLISVVIFVLFYVNAIIFYQLNNMLRNILLTVFYFAISVTIFFFSGLLYRIELKFPRYSHNNIFENSQQSKFNKKNTFNSKLIEKLNKNENCNKENLLLNNDECDLVSTTNNNKNFSLSKIQLPIHKNNENLHCKIIYETPKSNSFIMHYKDEDEDSGRLTLNSPHQTSSTLKKNELSDAVVNKHINESPISNIGTLSNSSNSSSQTQSNLNSLKNNFNISNNYINTVEKTDFLLENKRRKSQSINFAAVKLNNNIWTKPIFDNAKKLMLSQEHKNLLNQQFNTINYKNFALSQQLNEKNKTNAQNSLKFNQIYSTKITNLTNLNKPAILNYENNEISRLNNNQNIFIEPNNFSTNSNFSSTLTNAEDCENTLNLAKNLQNKKKIKKQTKDKINQDSNISNEKDDSNDYLNHPIVSVV